MPDRRGPSVWAVAGCLFEVSLPPSASSAWRLVDAGPDVTLLSEHVLATGRHLRFRAEAPGEVRLRFTAGDASEVVVVRIAPERREPEPPTPGA